MNRDRVEQILGRVPTDPWGEQLFLTRECSTCHEIVDEQRIAWGMYDYAPDTGTDVQCIDCALHHELERSRGKAAAA